MQAGRGEKAGLCLPPKVKLHQIRVRGRKGKKRGRAGPRLIWRKKIRNRIPPVSKGVGTKNVDTSGGRGGGR